MAMLKADRLKAKAYEAQLREIAGMLAQAPDGPLRWKQYRLVAVADFLGMIAWEPPADQSMGEG